MLLHGYLIQTIYVRLRSFASSSLEPLTTLHHLCTICIMRHVATSPPLVDSGRSIWSLTELIRATFEGFRVYSHSLWHTVIVVSFVSKTWILFKVLFEISHNCQLIAEVGLKFKKCIAWLLNVRFDCVTSVPWSYLDYNAFLVCRPKTNCVRARTFTQQTFVVMKILAI